MMSMNGSFGPAGKLGMKQLNINRNHEKSFC